MPLNTNYITKNVISEILNRGATGGQFLLLFLELFLIQDSYHVYHPISMQLIQIAKHCITNCYIMVTFENCKIIGGYRSLNMGVNMQLIKPFFLLLLIKEKVYDRDIRTKQLYNIFVSIGGARLVKKGSSSRKTRKHLFRSLEPVIT